MYFKYHPVEFFTATNLNWLHLLANDYHKQILVEALKHRTDSDQLTINAFVIMPNHFHAIWRVHDGIDRSTRLYETGVDDFGMLTHYKD